jgi:hypothetical protein
MQVFALRLKPEQDLRQSLKSFAQEQNIKAGFILTAIGSLKQATIRFANRDASTVLTEKFEILSLNGTLANTGVHLHLTFPVKCLLQAANLHRGRVILTNLATVPGYRLVFCFDVLDSRQDEQQLQQPN